MVCSEDGEYGEYGEESEDGYGCDGYGYDEDYSFEEYHPLDEPPASAPIITISEAVQAGLITTDYVAALMALSCV